MSSSNCCFLTCIQISQEAGQVVWYSHIFQNFPQFIVIHTVKGFGIVNKGEIDIFLKLSYFFYDPVDVGNLISGSSAFSKTTYNQLYCNKNFKKRKALCATLKSPSTSIHKHPQIQPTGDHAVLSHVLLRGKKSVVKYTWAVKTFVVQDQLYIVFFSLRLLYHSVSSCCSFLGGSYLSLSSYIGFPINFSLQCSFYHSGIFTW